MTAPRQFHTGLIGPLAWRRLACLPEARCGGRIIASFGSVFYVELETGLVCVGTRTVEPGPLTLLTSGTGGLDWRQFGISPGQPASASASGLDISGRIRIVCTNYVPWTPPALLSPPADGAIASGLAALAATLPADPVALGFGAFIHPAPRRTGLPRAIAAATAPVAAARQWTSEALSTGTGGPPEWALRLIGLGPGLTPSGDDYLGGMLIALRTLGFEAARRQLWRAVNPMLAERTNRISAELLKAAAQGYGGASLHLTLNALLVGGTGLAAALARVARIGHTSGWDALAGVVTVLAAMRDVGRRDAA